LRPASQGANLGDVPGTVLRVITWNLFHGRDGLPGLGATRASIWCRRPVDDGVHVHLNRKLTGLMADRLAAWAPDLCALQEVPTADVGTIVRRTGMHAVWTTTGPLVGPRRLRDALAARNPDLWRTHEGNANVLLVGPRLTLVPGGARALRLNPPGRMLRDRRRLRLEPGEMTHWLPEPRRLVSARLRLPGGGELVAGCVHAHNSRHPAVVGDDIARAAAEVAARAGGGPAVLAGDLNARPAHPVFAALAAEGWEGALRGGGIGIDRILHRGLVAVSAARRLPPDEREVLATWDDRTRRLRLSDHDPVLAELRLA
jgi:endonuclease/exonuclease/phosphatase family metal-dependent hydrolase